MIRVSSSLRFGFRITCTRSRLGFTFRSGRVVRGSFRLDRLLVRLTAIIGGVKPGPLEQQPRSRPDQSRHLPLAFGASPPWRITDLLKQIETITTLLALVFVSRHATTPSRT